MEQAGEQKMKKSQGVWDVDHFFFFLFDDHMTTFTTWLSWHKVRVAEKSPKLVILRLKNEKKRLTQLFHIAMKNTTMLNFVSQLSKTMVQSFEAKTASLVAGTSSILSKCTCYRFPSTCFWPLPYFFIGPKNPETCMPPSNLNHWHLANSRATHIVGAPTLLVNRNSSLDGPFTPV